VTEVASGWYPDPENIDQMRFWDGSMWTDERKPAAAAPPPPAAATAKPTAKARGLGAVRRLAEKAQASELGRTVVERGQAGVQRATATAKDPEQRAAFLATAYPMAEAAADGAGVRNKHGKVKTWRVARAAIRPRKSVAGVSKAVASEAGNQVMRSGDSAARRRAAEGLTPTLAEILADWPRVEPAQDRADWEEGLRRFEDADVEDHVEMRTCAGLMCEGLKHAIIEPAVIDGLADRTVETVADVIIAALQGNNPSTWGLEDERHARLALVVARHLGVQSEDLGGDGELGVLLDDHGSRMLMMAALSPTPWNFNLSAWFGVAPS